MTKRKGVWAFALAMIAFQVHAVTISLVSSTDKIHAPQSVLVDITIAGLHSGLASGNKFDSFLGAFSLDFLYDPSLFVPLPGPATGFGSNLGSVAQGEAATFIDGSVPGVLSLGLISLLSPADLIDLQGGQGEALDSFRLATLGFFAPFGGIPAMPHWPPASPRGIAVFDTQNVILGDEQGNAVFVRDGAGNPVVDQNGDPVPTPIVTPTVTVQVLEPPTLISLGLGLLLLVCCRNRARW